MKVLSITFISVFMMIIVGTIIKKDNKLLMIKEGKKEYFGKWSFPAGHLEKGENIINGALRETKEETGCLVKLTYIFPITEIHKENVDILRITFLADLIEEMEIPNGDEILEKKWFSVDEIKCIPKEDIRQYEDNLSLLKSFENNEIYPLEILNCNIR